MNNDDVYERSHAHINQCFGVCGTHLADRWKPQAQCRGSPFWSALTLYHPLPPLLSPCPSALTKQKESFSLAQTSPRTGLQAVEAPPPPLPRRDKCSPAFDTTGRDGRKCRSNIHTKITRLAAMENDTEALTDVLVFHIYEHSEVFSTVPVLSLWVHSCSYTVIFLQFVFTLWDLAKTPVSLSF